MILKPSDLGFPPERFPFYRKSQDEIAIRIAESDKRVFVLGLPPGIGKSLINVSAALLYGKRSLFLVPNKALQAQLYLDMSPVGMFSISGHSNYPCSHSTYDEEGDLLETGCRAPAGRCQYKDVDVVQANKADLIDTNYHHWITMARMEDPNRLGKFDFICLDEAHELTSGDLLSRLLSVAVDSRVVASLLRVGLPKQNETSIHGWVAWSKEIYPRVQEVHSKASKQKDTETSSKLIRLLRSLETLSSIKLSEDWVVEHDGSKIRFSPVWGREYVERYLFRGASKIVLSSGTFTKLDCEYLGIKEADLEFIDVASGFPASRRPIYYVPTTRVDFKMSDAQKRHLVNRIDSVVSSRSDRKTIVQSRAYHYSDYIQKHSRYASNLIFHKPGGLNVKRAVEEFKRAKPPSIRGLVSPAIEEGIDFIGDYARVCIVLKVPFLDRRDPITAARIKSDPRYSDMVVCKKLTQQFLRIIRQLDDWGEGFIFDDHFAYFRKNDYFSYWFKQAFRKVDTIPAPLKF